MNDDDVKTPFTDDEIRMFIVEKMADADIDGHILVENMELVFKWIKTGIATPRKVERKLKVKDEKEEQQTS